MHDFLLAKEIIEKVLEIVKEKNLQNISAVFLEVGSITMAHDGIPDHAEDINIENLQFGLKSLAKNTILESARFEVKRSKADTWKIKNIKVE